MDVIPSARLSRDSYAKVDLQKDQMSAKRSVVMEGIFITMSVNMVQTPLLLVVIITVR